MSQIKPCTHSYFLIGYKYDRNIPPEIVTNVPIKWCFACGTILTGNIMNYPTNFNKNVKYILLGDKYYKRNKYETY